MPENKNKSGMVGRLRPLEECLLPLRSLRIKQNLYLSELTENRSWTWTGSRIYFGTGILVLTSFLTLHMILNSSSLF